MKEEMMKFDKRKKKRRMESEEGRKKKCVDGRRGRERGDKRGKEEKGMWNIGIVKR